MKIFHKKSRRWIAAGMAAAILLTTLVYGLASTFALPQPVSEYLTQPADSYDQYAYTIPVGQAALRNITNVNEAWSSDSTMATVAVAKKVSITIAAKDKAGGITVSAGNKSGAVSVTRWQITNPAGITGYELPTGGNGYREKADLAATNLAAFLAAQDVKLFTSQAAEKVAEQDYYKSETANAASSTNMKLSYTQLSGAALTAALSGIEWHSSNEDVLKISGTGAAATVQTGGQLGVTLLNGSFTDRWGEIQHIHFLYGVGVKPWGDNEFSGGGNNTNPEGLDSNGPGGPGTGGSFILDDTLTGDTGVNWIAIAQTEDYLLIVRDTILAGSEDAFGGSNAYGGSTLKNTLATWYATAPAKLRYYNVRSNANDQLGAVDGDSDRTGLSIPATGAKGAFALSYYESFHFINGSGAGLALNNWNNLSDESTPSWLRTAGSGANSLVLSASGNRASVSRSNANAARPAMWVDKGILTGEGGDIGGGGGTSNPATGMTLSPETLSLAVGATETITVTKVPGDTTDTLSVSSSNNGVATAAVVGGNIVVTGVAAGTATITVTLGSVEKTIAVTVNGAIGTPEEGTGRTFTDTSGTWLEIATNGGYSLILRTTNLEAPYGPAVFGSNENYLDANCTARNNINTWYASVASSALIKQYAVDNTAMSNMGTYAQNGVNQATGTSGISAPLETRNQPSDIAFILSSEEASRYCCRFYWNGSVSVDRATANDRAYNNWLALTDRANSWWLRSPHGTGRVCGVGYNGYIDDSTLYGYGVTENYFSFRPALWVESAIFNPAPPTEGIPNEGTGRKTDGGDGSEWIEIATNGGYSLILRANSLPSPYGPSAFGSNSDYLNANCSARNNINSWYNSVSSSAKIKQYAAGNNATSKIGTWNGAIANVNGFSSPIASKPEAGENDVAFLLSLHEAATFCGTGYWTNGAALYTEHATTDQAHKNWTVLKNLGDGGSVRWCLRTPIGTVDVHGVYFDGTVGGGGMSITNSFGLRPALWVETSKFTWTNF